ncbi:hypothetical protein HY642_03630 [Candidatus Woesearchaeota archaeon]|nr:hypothetical protein [Candidatus Woesearchaeota archaeon]
MKAIIIGVLLLLAACSPKNTIEVTFANEARKDISIKAFVDSDLTHTTQMLLSSKTQGSYLGKEIEIATVEVPEQPFVFQVSTGSDVAARTIDPAGGRFVQVTYWDDKFTIEQSIEKVQRID